MHAAYKYVVLGTCVLALSGCYVTEIEVASHLFKRARGADTSCSGAQPHLKVGNPYRIKGVKYYPKKSSFGYKEEGVASWYGADFHEKLTANGECYNMYALTAAHKTLPLPTTVRVTNLENGRSIVLRVNDRGPYAKGRIIDLSYAAAKKLGMAEQGVAPVRVEAIGGPHHKPGGAGAAKTYMVKKTTPSTPRASGSSLTKRVVAAAQPVQKPTTSTPKRSSFTESISQKAATKPVQGGSFTRRVTAQNLEPAAGKPTPEEQKRLAQKESADVITTAAREQAVPTTVVEDLTPPSVEKAPKTSTAPLKGGVQLYVQTGAFSNEQNAERQLTLLKELAANAGMVKIERAGRTLHRVRSGPYHSVAEADTMLSKLVDAGFNTAVIAVDK